MDLKGKKLLLEQEEALIDATKARNLKVREIHLLRCYAVDSLIVNANTQGKLSEPWPCLVDHLLLGDVFVAEQS